MKRVYLDKTKAFILIRQKNLRQYQVARRINISPAQFSQYLQGRSRIDRALLAALCRILNVNKNEITDKNRR